MKQLTKIDEFHIRFLFYRIGMGAPSIAPVLKLPIGVVEKYCKDLPTNERRREIQLRTRYAGRHRHYEKRQKRLDENEVSALYAAAGRYDNVRPAAIDIEMPAMDPVQNMIGMLVAAGTSCTSRADGLIEVGTDTVTQNRLAAITVSMVNRNRRKITDD